MISNNMYAIKVYLRCNVLRFQSVGVVGVVERLTPKELCFPTLKALLVADRAHPQEVVTRQYYARVYHEKNVP